MSAAARYPDVPRDFGFGEDHALLRDAARRFLAERCPMAEVRRLAEDPVGHDPALWKEMAALGWAGLVLPEVHGGAGLGALHLALLMEEMGRRLLPSPFLAVLLAGLALERAGDQAQRGRWCPGLASGELVGTLAFAEPEGSWEPGAVRAVAEPAGEGFVLRGAKAYVPAAPSAGLVVAPFRVESGVGDADGELALFAVELPRAGVRVDPEVNVDATRRTGRVVFDGARVEADARLAGEATGALDAVWPWGWTALAAEMVGCAEALLVMTRDYAVERVQFDRPIGSFQAVKHPIVDMMVGVEGARTLALAAAAALDAAEDDAALAARMAKAAAGDALDHAARKSIQLHGGYGFTWDCDAHFFFKRSLWARATLGDSLHHRRHLADALLGPRE